MTDRIVIVCGGTGGHFYPGLSIAVEHMRNGGHPKIFLTGRNAGQQAQIANGQGIESKILPSSPAPKGLRGKISFILHSLKCILESRKKLKAVKPDAVLSMGSFHSAAPSIAAWTLGIPLFIHDGNARIGKANLFLSRFAHHMALSFPPVNDSGIRCKWTVAGMPMRHQIAGCSLDKAEAVKLLNSKTGSNFSAGLPIILVFGGSQGAEGINQRMPEAMKMQGDEKFQLIHISGTGNRENLEKAYSGAGFAYKIIENTGEMEILYSASDLVICRSGGSTIAELAIFAKFAILVPYPHATDNHQDDNANHYCSCGAGIKFPESELSVNKLASTIASFLENPAEFAEKGLCARTLAKPNAAAEILKLIEKFVDKVEM
ncbi:MAG: hypothetical protein A2X48_11675 [Lentisphaerae bacterium GWF2_49_21]|nr:MAG: hypothetical protein A2X48_11675 [Lentisphaerae bacterium GWF2_49_21]